jgi:hypothetical protein
MQSSDLFFSTIGEPLAEALQPIILGGAATSVLRLASSTVGLSQFVDHLQK